MLTIWKFPVEPNSVYASHNIITLDVPFGSTMLCVMNQDDAVCIWAEVDTEEVRKETVKFACIGTGHGAVPKGGKYFGSVVDGHYVWHFYRLYR